MMLELNIEDRGYDRGSDVSDEGLADGENIPASNDTVAAEKSKAPEFRIFDIARKISERGYRHRSLRRSSSIF